MQIDRYTKAVLTVIALALSAIAVRSAGGPAIAQSRDTVQKVVVCGENGNRCADVKAFGAFSERRLLVAPQ